MALKNLLPGNRLLMHLIPDWVSKTYPPMISRKIIPKAYIEANTGLGHAPNNRTYLHKRLPIILAFFFKSYRDNYNLFYESTVILFVQTKVKNIKLLREIITKSTVKVWGSLLPSPESGHPYERLGAERQQGLILCFTGWTNAKEKTSCTAKKIQTPVALFTWIRRTGGQGGDSLCCLDK